MAGYTLEGSLGFNPVTEPKIFESYLVDADQAAEINKNEPVYVMSTGEIAAWTPTVQWALGQLLQPGTAETWLAPTDVRKDDRPC